MYSQIISCADLPDEAEGQQPPQDPDAGPDDGPEVEERLSSLVDPDYIVGSPVPGRIQMMNQIAGQYVRYALCENDVQILRSLRRNDVVTFFIKQYM